MIRWDVIVISERLRTPSGRSRLQSQYGGAERERENTYEVLTGCLSSTQSFMDRYRTVNRWPLRAIFTRPSRMTGAVTALITAVDMHSHRSKNR